MIEKKLCVHFFWSGNRGITKFCVFAKTRLTVRNMGRNCAGNWLYPHISREFYRSDGFKFICGGIQPIIIDFLSQKHHCWVTDV